MLLFGAELVLASWPSSENIITIREDYYNVGLSKRTLGVRNVVFNPIQKVDIAPYTCLHY